MTLIQNPPITPLAVMQVIPPIPSLDTIHITSPKPESLPTPLWFMDRLSKDLPQILPILRFISLRISYPQPQFTTHNI
jgi:hypothetical protein